ncbi:colanic acid biosynthesis glycosyl transferase WcaI [Pedobacter hartonius]|uniref:Colanic acid biosynthesis glycosyl transferase WcaI n=2 Tax=Pedobacter hartonius TaxID=425514 RepID=A0A1H4FN76_9SPHI|nr:colanic acid biosynthesis glycosyl transferase WcaI [Pedobacter hartonius]
MVMKKRILVLGINCLPELTGIGKYTGEMVSWMAEQGHETTMITGFPYYPNWKVQEPYKGNWYINETMFDGNLKIYRCPLYIPSKPSGLKRLIHESVFFVSAGFAVLKMLFKPKQDLIIAIAPPFHLAILALFYRFFKGGRILYHVQDLQIEAAKELKMLRYKWMFDMLFSIEYFILRKMDFISTISEGMMKRVGNKIPKRITFFPNWVDTETFYPLPDRNGLKTKWGFKRDDYVVLYSGSIGEKQGLDSLIRIAENLKAYENIQFVICGTGPYKQELIRMTTEKQLPNLEFLPLQGFDVFNEFLNMADIHLVLQKANASDLVMPSKLTTILAVGGLALVTANPGTTLHDVITEHGMGVIVEAEREDLLGAAIINIVENDHEPCRKNARKYAEKYLDKRNILPDMLNFVTQLSNKN